MYMTKNMKDANDDAQVRTIHIKGEKTEIYADFPVRVSCLEHLEREIDDYVNQYETAPDVFRRGDVDDPAAADTCMVCGAGGQAVLLRVKGM
ncbi:CxxH/CxxC protein [Brevibacillus massiliensis]|jgi:CxxH/CxxC protein (TIGR04129 family)|uniref:CxxH/CxxC protein n=2 Tax=Brevibacillus massiliensis TaxID=1118054 RepID=UPI0002E98F53|nr:CxxH/CxxC protein [Brevibacillus massiliensis]